MFIRSVNFTSSDIVFLSINNKLSLFKIENGQLIRYNRANRGGRELTDIMTQQASNLKLAERGALIGIAAYIILAAFKLMVGHYLKSSSLVADGSNNMSDIAANLAVLIGLRLARQPADTNHKFGHWKIEDLASLITSFLMFAVGFDLLWDTVQKMIRQELTPVDPVGALVGLFSAAIMFAVYAYNTYLAKRVSSKALKAAAKDNLSDALTSVGTSVAILASALHFPIIDKITALIITILILKTAYDIFKEAAFTLSDGFDEKLLDQYEADILKLPNIIAVKAIRGRSYGSHIYLDVILEMHPQLSVYDSHTITEQVEELLAVKHQVIDVDIHVEPAQSAQNLSSQDVASKLYHLENQILARQSDCDKLIRDDCILITSEGQMSDKNSFLAFSPSLQQITATDLQLTNISCKSRLIIYQVDQTIYTSVWHCGEEDWQLVFHQEAPKRP